MTRRLLFKNHLKAKSHKIKKTIGLIQTLFEKNKKIYFINLYICMYKYAYSFFFFFLKII